jgi:hypothetical protein
LRRLLPLAGIVIFVWAMLLLSMLLISRVAFDFSIGTETLFDRIVTQTVRVLVSGTIILVWLFVWKKITDRYFWRTIGQKRAT